MRKLTVPETKQIIDILKEAGYDDLSEKMSGSCSSISAYKRLDKWHKDNKVSPPPLGNTGEQGKTTTPTRAGGDDLGRHKIHGLGVRRKITQVGEELTTVYKKTTYQLEKIGDEYHVIETE